MSGACYMHSLPYCSTTATTTTKCRIRAFARAEKLFWAMFVDCSAAAAAVFFHSFCSNSRHIHSRRVQCACTERARFGCFSFYCSACVFFFFLPSLILQLPNFVYYTFVQPHCDCAMRTEVPLLLVRIAIAIKYILRATHTFYSVFYRLIQSYSFHGETRVRSRQWMNDLSSQFIS